VRRRQLARVKRRPLRYDITLAETMNGLYGTKLVRNKGPWWGLDNLELATLE